MIKLSRQISCGCKILDKLGVRIKKIKNTLLVGFFVWWDGTGRTDGTDGRDGRDGRSTKVSFNFLHTLWAFRTCIYILKYILKNCHQHSYGFQNFMSSWGSWSKISNLKQVGDFSFLGYKHNWRILWIPKLNFSTQKKKNHLPALILKF